MDFDIEQHVWLYGLLWHILKQQWEAARDVAEQERLARLKRVVFCFRLGCLHRMGLRCKCVCKLSLVLELQNKLKVMDNPCFPQLQNFCWMHLKV